MIRHTAASPLVLSVVLLHVLLVTITAFSPSSSSSRSSFSKTALSSSTPVSETETAERTLETTSTVPERPRTATTTTTFYILRHGETDSNAADIIQGSSDEPRLTAAGRRQALEFGAQRLAAAIDRPIDRVYVSPLTRARDTLELVRRTAPAGALPSEHTILSDLREIDLYSWENQSKQHLQRRYPAQYAAWKTADPDELTVDGRRPLHETWARADSVWKEIRQHVQPQSLTTDTDGTAKTACNVLLVCHGVLGQALLATAFGNHDPATTFRRNPFENCGMAEIVWHCSEDRAEQWRWVH